jgi:hypothetical protein
MLFYRSPWGTRTAPQETKRLPLRGHLFDELRYVVQARYPINAKHRAGTFTKARTEDEFDFVLPSLRHGRFVGGGSADRCP